MKPIIKILKLSIILSLTILPSILIPDPIPEIELSDRNKSLSIGKEIEIFEDTSGTLSIHNLLHKDFKGEFKKLSREFINLGFTKSKIWVRFNLNKNADVISRSPWIIINEFPMIDHTHFYQIDKEGTVERAVETGLMHPVSSRDHIFYKIVFLSNIPPGETRTYYISFQTNSLLSIHLRVLSMTEFMRESGIKTGFIGIFIGVFVFLCGYHLFLFLVNREYIHLYFSLTILSMLFFALSYTGYAGLYLWPDILWINRYSIPLFASLILIFLLNFINSFFELRQKKAFFYRLSRLLIFSLIIFTSLLIVTGSEDALLITEFITTVTFFSTPVIVLLLEGGSEKKPFYFVTGILIFAASVLLFGFDKLSIINIGMFSEYALRIGPGIFIILTTLSLAERTKVLKAEKEKFKDDLRDSKLRFRSLVESSYDIIWETDIFGKFTYISPNVKEMLGYDSREILGGDINDFFKPELNNRKPNPFTDPEMKKDPVLGLINEIIDSYDKHLIFEINALPFFNSRNEFQGYRGINRDITVRRRSEKVQEIILNISNAVNSTLNMNQFYEIIHSELNKLVDATNFFVGIYDEESDTISLPYLKDEMDKYEKTDAEGTISALVIKGNRSLLLKPDDITKLENEGEIGVVGTPCKIWLGVPLEVESKVIGLLVLQSYDDENAYSEYDLKLMEFIAGQIAVSISKKQIEERIHILAQSVEQSPALIIITDLNANIEYVNKKFVDVTGYTMEEVIGTNPGFLKSGKIPKRIYHELWRNLTRGNEWRGEFHNKKKNGDFYWEHAFITPIKNEMGKISHFLAIKEDITERKELGLQLIQSQKMESIGTLAGGISHDFNNILTVINGYADLALMRLAKTDPLYQEISTIKKAGRRGEKLTRQIMAFSRKQIFHPVVININNVIKDLENMLKSLIEEDFNISFKLLPDIPNIKADPGQIEQILINLLVNARDAINLKTERAGEKEIIVETGIQIIEESFLKKHAGSNPGPHIYISISDNGIGMSDDVRQNIFEPFFTTKIRGKGTGMGLATVYGIVKQNNSSIIVESELHKGSTFKILWPVTSEKISNPDSKEIDKLDLHGNENILFVEDDKHVKDFAVTALENFGYQVHSSINGKQALEYIRNMNIKFDILITDLVMPDMNGKELSENVLTLFPGMKILFTSGYTENHLVKSGELEEGINFLAKPYTAKSLLTFVRMILNPKG